MESATSLNHSVYSLNFEGDFDGKWYKVEQVRIRKPVMNEMSNSVVANARMVFF